MEPEEQEEREPEEAELLIVPALKFGAFTGRASASTALLHR